MCWNASVSLNTYIFSLFTSIFAYYNKVIGFDGFCLYQCYITMQLIEYFTWTKMFSNKILSIMASIVILLQPIFSAFFIHDTVKRNYLLLLYATVCVITFTIIKPINKIVFKMEPAENGHLEWFWLDFPQYIIFLWLTFLLIPFFAVKYYIGFVAILFTFIITYIYYSKSRTYGSLWCWVANFFSIFFLIKIFYKDLCVNLHSVCGTPWCTKTE